MSQATQIHNTPLAMDPHSDNYGEAEVDEPPERKEYFLLDSLQRHDAAFTKFLPPAFARRESLLTRQLTHTEPEHHVEDEHHRARAVVRGMSTWSNPSIASTAELTSDNDLTSPGTRDNSPSPPLSATIMRGPVPMLDKIASKEPVIVEQNEEAQKNYTEVPEKKVEATLGRPRCITFACGRKPSSTISATHGDASETTAKPQPEPDKGSERPQPVQRKCTLTFACPARPTLQPTLTQEKVKSSRNISPAPIRITRPPASPRVMPKTHRGSDATVKNESPKSVRKMPSMVRRRKYSAENDDIPAEERRFHEFGPSEEEAEQWLEESGCHRRPLTVNDTLHKENIIRRIGEEVEEEALEDEEEELEEDEEDIDEDEGDDIDAVEDASDDEESDAGFHSDDEEGFAVSDSDNDDSDTEWWAPGRSTAATSTDHLEHIRPSRPRTHSQSSMESASADVSIPRVPHGNVKRRSRAVNIHRPRTPDLPDSTDFVCGTLDEDRPLEQAYISCIEQRKAAKHKARPQDIDPTFPTSDPEMDEEDEDDEEEEKVDESDHPFFMQGNMDLHNDEPDRRGRRISAAGLKKKSPSPPHQRLRSPPPAKRAVHRSPPPAKRMRSPPVPIKRAANKSPAPVKRVANKSPAPVKRAAYKSLAPPRRLFGQSSPNRYRSPAPSRRLASPRPSRSTSVEGTPAISFTPRATLAQRPQPTHTASLPRVASAIKLGRHRLDMSPYEHDDNVEGLTTRGAIDIVKGLEKKRQRRKEKLYQKHCNRANKDAHRKPRPGKGAERMREVGLELAAYKGKREHMLSY
ncbi:hypothetical protein MBLNU459_g3498t1 [Dothideomycetes sp. NU459]